jgi:hypothetical protein
MGRVLWTPKGSSGIRGEKGFKKGSSREIFSYKGSFDLIYKKWFKEI